MCFPSLARRLVLLIALAMLAAAHGVYAQTTALLRAPHVQSRVRVQWDPAHRRIVAAVDEDGQYSPLGFAPPFLTDDGIAVTYPRLNPLRVSATIATRDAAVPADAAMTRLRALLSFATVSVPSADTSPVPFSAPGLLDDSCAAAGIAQADAGALMSRLFVTPDSPTVAALVGAWRRSIDDAFAAGASGPDAVSAALTRIDTFVAQLDRQIGESERVVSRIDAATATAPSQPCEASARAVYDIVKLANPRARLVQLAAVRAAVVEVRDVLSRDYVAPGPERWQGSEYRLDPRLRPTRESPVTVTVRATQLDFDVDESTGALTRLEEHDGADALVAQRFSRFTSEFAVASVVTSVTTKGYGTTTNAAGETVIGRLPRSMASVAPAFLASYTCRCRTGPLIAPMLQIGVATSADTPGILAGGGIRLFGLPKGEAALGAGAMLAWVKDLRTLRPGDPVGGTKDIQADLHFVRRNGYYLALQYKF